jgi:hypothetical protein
MRVHAALLAAALSVGLAAEAAADRRGPGVIVVPGAPYGQTLDCWSDVRLFQTLRDGYFPYCREKLRYRPGALECFQLYDQVCTVWVPGSARPFETRSMLNKQIIPCPDGPQPPVCRRLDVQ